MQFELLCEENHKTYTEEDFDELVELYDDGDIENNSIALYSLTLEIINTYDDNEITPLSDVTTIEDMQDLISTLENIESLDDHDLRKLESIIEYNLSDDVATAYEGMCNYDWFDCKSFEELADKMCSSGKLGDSVLNVYNENRNFLDMSYIGNTLKLDYTLTEYGIIKDY